MSKIGDFADKLRIKITNRLFGRLEKKEGEQALIDCLNPAETTLAIYGFLKEQGFKVQLRLQFPSYCNLKFWGTGASRPPVCISLFKGDEYHCTLLTEWGDITLCIDQDLHHTSYDLADPNFFDKLLADVQEAYNKSGSRGL